MGSRDWHKADIKAALEKAGTTMSAIARDNDLDPSAVRQAVRNHRPMPRIKALIARAIGVPPQTIWPSLFDEAGHPICTRRRRQFNTSCRRHNVSGRIHRSVA